MYISQRLHRHDGPGAPLSKPESGEKSASREIQPVPIRATSVKRFGIAWVVSVLLCFPIYALIMVSWMTYYRSRDAAWMDFLYQQKEVLLKRRAAQGHRLIIVGGSNALFGIDAELIERKLHVPTVNLGTHAGLGLSYMLYRVRNKMRPGDIILLDPEYDLWEDIHQDTAGPAFSYIWTHDKTYLAHISFSEAAKMIASVPLSDWRADAQWKADLEGTGKDFRYQHFDALRGYNVASMDPNGDLRVVVWHHPPPVDLGMSNSFLHDPNPRGLVSLRAFAAEAKARGIRVMMSWPNFMRPAPMGVAQLANPPAWFSAAKMAEIGVTLLNEPLETTFPPEWFADTAYHASQCCRRVRTEQLIERLRPQLGLPPVPDKATGVFLVAGYAHQLTDGNLFADDPGIRFRYLREEDPSEPLGVTPAEVARLVSQGTPVYTDSEEAAPLLAKAGLTEQLSATGKISIADWFARYPAHIFCLAAPPNHPFDPVWKTLVPDRVYRQLCVENEPCAMVFGSGGFAPHCLIVSDPINAHLEVDLPTLFQRKAMIASHVGVEAWAKEGGGPLAKIWVDLGDFPEAKQGILVSVIDPALTAVIETVTFDGGPDLQTWRRFRVVASNPATKP